MATTVTLNGTPYSIPQVGDEQWGDDVTNWIVAASSGLLQKSGGSFTLTGEIDFGGNFGLNSIYYKSRSGSISTSGILRLSNTDKVGFRNATNSGNLLLGVNVSNQLEFEGSVFLTTSGTLTANRATITNGSSALASSSVTSTELGYLSGVTSALQTQINAKEASFTILPASKGGTGVANNDAATLTRSGNHSLSLTTSANTTLTLPTIGTLATLAGAEILTTKTLTAPILNGIKVANSSATTDVTLTTSDVVKRLDASAGAFNVTLPAAANGITLTLIKTDSTFAAVTIKDASAATVTTLNTQGESVTLVCDGTSYAIQNRYIPSAWVSYTPTFTGFGTVSVQTFHYRRVGDSLQIKGRFTSGTPTGVEARVSFPSLLVADSGKMQATLESLGAFDSNTASSTTFFGQYVAVEPSATYLVFTTRTSTTTGLVKRNGSNFIANGEAISIPPSAVIPIVGWN